MRVWIPWPLSIGATCSALLALHALAPAISVSPVVAFVIAFACVCAGTLLTTWYVPVTPPRALAGCVLPIVMLLWVRSTHGAGVLHATLVLASLLAIGTLMGTVIGGRIQAAGHLLFVAIVSSAVDVFSVFAPTGPTAALIASPQAIQLLALPWPMLGTPDLVPILGVGDVVFAALYRSAARAHGVDPARSLAALVCGFALTLAALLIVQQPIPALPFLGLSVVALVPQTRAVPEADRRTGWAGITVLLVVLAVLARYRP